MSFFVHSWIPRPSPVPGTQGSSSNVCCEEGHVLHSPGPGVEPQRADCPPARVRAGLARAARPEPRPYMGLAVVWKVACSGDRMPELCGLEQVAGLSVPHIPPLQKGERVPTSQVSVGVQGDVRALRPTPFQPWVLRSREELHRWGWGQGRTCRRCADTHAAPRPRRAPAPSSIRDTR